MLNTPYEVDVTTLIDYTIPTGTNLVKISASATAGRTLTLPLARESDDVFIYNASAYQVTIAANSADSIIGPVLVPSGGTAHFQASAQTKWYSFGSLGGGVGNLVSYRQVCPYTAFTDGGGAAGTLALGVSIPAGAVYARTLYSGLTGFAGNTSAVGILGDGTDTDRYCTGSPDLFTTAAAGVDAGVPSGTLFHSAAKTPTLTVTSNSDWGLVTAGSVVVTMFWYSPF